MSETGPTTGITAYLSQYIGVTEPALKLLLTLLAGYPLALIHRKYLHGKDAAIQHLFFILSGFCLGYWNYGRDMFHCVFTIFFTYATLFFLGGTTIAVAVSFLFNLGYLILGYLYSSTNEYDINWTMPQCILVLRLIGVTYDVYDGNQPLEKLSNDSKKVALQKHPSILEIFGHCLFPASFMIGPQFSMRRYQEFVAGTYGDKENGKPPDSVKASVIRFLLGVAYISIYQVLGLFVSDDLILSDEYGNTCFFKKMLLLGIWGRFTLYKYISCWLLTEGACILFGISYTKDKDGKVDWNGVENIKLTIFENTTEFNHYIQSFNVNTNQWSAHYIYKRLKFLGNRHISQIATLLFLAVWHGFHSGYYICFFFEFIVIYMERDIKSIVQSNEYLKNFFGHAQIQLVLNVLLRIYTFVFMGWCLLPFGLLTFDKYWKAYRNANYVGFLLFGLWPLVYSPIIKFALKSLKKNKEHVS